MGRKKTISNPEEFALSLGSYGKSNRLINSRGKSTAINLKIMAIGLQRIERLEDGTLQSVIPGQQLRAILGNYNGSFYTQLKALCDPASPHATITSWTTFVEETDKRGAKRFKAMVLIPTARFENGQLTLTFNKEAEDDIFNLKKNYTILSIAQMVKMRSPYSIQMYERFKSAMDLEKSRTGSTGPYYVEYTVQELKDDLGLGQVRDIAGRVTQKEMFTRYDTFRSHVLDIIKSEITEMSTIAVDYRPIRMGIGGKVTSIQFILRWQTLQDTVAIPTEEIDLDAAGAALAGESQGGDVRESLAAESQSASAFNILDAAALFGPEFTLQDVLAVCEAAGNDMQAVRRVCELAAATPNIKNKTGWMIAALRGNYAAVAGTASGGNAGNASVAAGAVDGTSGGAGTTSSSATLAADSAGTASGKTYARKRAVRNSFTDFEQNVYDFDELERQLLGNG